MRYYLLLCSLFFISLVGCKKTAKVSIPGEIISISPVSDPGTLNISDYLTNIRFIPLQTNDSCLLSSTLNLKVNDNCIYISNKQAIVYFDDTGKFISKIKHQGRGPFEYVSLTDFVVLKDNKIAVLDNAKKRLIIYDLTKRNSLKTIDLGCFSRACEMVNDSIIVVTADYYKPDDLFHFYNIRTSEKIKSCTPLHQQKLSYCHIMGHRYFTKQGNTLLYSEPFNPDILKVSLDTVLTRYHISTPSNPPEDFYMTEFNDVREFIEEFKRKKYVATGGNFAVGENYLLTSFNACPAAKYCFIELQTSRNFNFKSIYLPGNIEIENFQIIPLNDGEICIVIPAIELCGKSVNQPFTNIAETDNPILCIGKIK